MWVESIKNGLYTIVLLRVFKPCRQWVLNTFYSHYIAQHFKTHIKLNQIRILAKKHGTDHHESSPCFLTQVSCGVHRVRMRKIREKCEHKSRELDVYTTWGPQWMYPAKNARGILLYPVVLLSNILLRFNKIVLRHADAFEPPPRK